MPGQAVVLAHPTEGAIPLALAELNNSDVEPIVAALDIGDSDIGLAARGLEQGVPGEGKKLLACHVDLARQVGAIPDPTMIQAPDKFVKGPLQLPKGLAVEVVEVGPELLIDGLRREEPEAGLFNDPLYLPLACA